MYQSLYIGYLRASFSFNSLSMTDTDDNSIEDDIYKDVEVFVALAITANWATMMLRKCFVVPCVAITLIMDVKGAKTSADKSVMVLQALGLLVVGILPLWTKPKISAARLYSWKISPYQLTGAVLTLSTLLLSLGVVFFYVVKNWTLVYLLVFLNSVLVNEIKWSEAYFSTNWFPKNKYGDVLEKSKNLAFVFTIFSPMIGTYLQNIWFFTSIPVFVLFVSFFVAFKLEHLLDQETEYKQWLEENGEYAPLAEWNDPNSYDYYKVDIRQQSWGQFYTYYFFQFL